MSFSPAAILRKDLIAVGGQRLADLLKVLFADEQAELLRLQLVLLIQLWDRLDFCTAHGIKCANRKIQISDIHLTNPVLSGMI